MFLQSKYLGLRSSSLSYPIGRCPLARSRAAQQGAALQLQTCSKPSTTTGDLRRQGGKGGEAVHRTVPPVTSASVPRPPTSSARRIGGEERGSVRSALVLASQERGTVRRCRRQRAPCALITSSASFKHPHAVSGRGRGSRCRHHRPLRHQIHRQPPRAFVVTPASLHSPK